MTDEELRDRLETVINHYESADYDMAGGNPVTRIMQLIAARDEQREREIRIDELDRYPAVITEDMNDLQRVNSIQTAYYNNRIAELNPNQQTGDSE